MEIESQTLKQIGKDRGMANIIKFWKNQLAFKYRKGFNSFRRKLTPVIHAQKLTESIWKALRVRIGIGFKKIVHKNIDAKVYLNSLVKRLQNDTKDAFLVWKNALQYSKIKTLSNEKKGLKKDVKKSKLRSSKATAKTFESSLNKVLVTLLNKTYKSITHNPLDVARGPLTNLKAKLEKIPREALSKWKKYINSVNNKELLDVAKSEKLFNRLKQVSARTVRDGFQRIYGSGNKIQGALKIIFATIHKCPRVALIKWKQYVRKVEQKEFYDNFRSLKVKSSLEKIVIRTTRDAEQRIIGGGNRLKGALQGLISGLNKVPKNALKKWFTTVSEIKDKNLFDNARSLKLIISLGKIEKRTLKDATERVKGSVFAMPKLFNTLRILDSLIKRKPKEAFEELRKHHVATHNKEILDNVKNHKLFISLNKVTKRTLRDATQRIIGDGSKAKVALKNIYRTMKKTPKIAFEKWKKYLRGVQNKEFFDNVRSLKLKTSLEKVTKRTIRDSTQRIIGQGDKVKGAMQNIVNGLKNIPKKALRNWNKTVQNIKEKKLFDNARSAKLLNSLEKIQRRTLKESTDKIRNVLSNLPHAKLSLMRLNDFSKRRPKEAFESWRKYVEGINNKEILDNVRSQKLLIKLNNLTKRILRDATQRMTGEGDKVKGAIKKVYSTLLRKPKTAFDKWKKYLEGLKHKDFFDNLRSAKLSKSLAKIPLRTIKDANQRIIGGGDKIKGALKSLIDGLKNIPKKALRNWNKTVQEIKEKKLFDNARTIRLQFILERLVKKNLKNAAEKIIKKDENVKDKIKNIFEAAQNIQKIALDKWKKYLQQIKNKDLFDNLRSSKLINCLNKIPTRVAHDSIQRILGGGSKVKGAMQNIVNGLKNIPKKALRNWNNTVRDINEKKLFDNVRSAKLLNSLEKIQRRTLKESTDRIKDVVSNSPLVKLTLMRLNDFSKRKPKDAFEK